MKDIDQKLNLSQKEAVMYMQGPLLVVAGAGSGKTKTLVYRVAKLIDSGIPAYRILLLTFTRRASKEMLNRATEILDDRCQHVVGGTFHSFANQILRHYSAEIGFSRSFTILDRGDSEDILQLIRKDYLEITQDRRFPKKSTLLTLLSKRTNTNKSLESIISIDYPQCQPFLSTIERIAIRYTEQKKQMDVMDYDDLLIYLHHLLKNHQEIRYELIKKYDHIMIDEYQDTNKIQAAIIKYLVNENNNVMAVGDDAQSIYSFRGADYQNIMHFPKVFSNTHIIKLEQNYRSSQAILNLTNAVISQAKNSYGKNLFSNNSQGIKPMLVETDSDQSQSKYVANKIKELCKSGIPLREIAVLIRSGWHSNDLEIVLKSENLPFMKFGGMKFVETSHIKDVVAYLRVIANPLDALSWMRILILIEGLGSKSAEAIYTCIKESRKKNELLDLSIFKKKRFYSELVRLNNMLFSFQNTKEESVSSILHRVLTYYKPLLSLNYDDHIKRLNDLNSLSSIAERFISLEELLTDLALDPPEIAQTKTNQRDNSDTISISTIHSAKGLEWHTVFLISAVDGYLPSTRSLSDDDQLEEERRLMYVALTRAKENLVVIKPDLNSPANRYKSNLESVDFSKISRFLQDVDMSEICSSEKINKLKISQIKNNKIQGCSSNFPDYFKSSFKGSKQKNNKHCL